jgi:hypothetical protein
LVFVGLARFLEAGAASPWPSPPRGKRGREKIKRLATAMVIDVDLSRNGESGKIFGRRFRDSMREILFGGILSMNL